MMWFGEQTDHSEQRMGVLKDFMYLFLERGREGEERKRNINVWLPLAHPLLGTRTTTQACALTGNRTSSPRNWTSNSLVHRPALNSLSHTSQGWFLTREMTWTGKLKKWKVDYSRKIKRWNKVTNLEIVNRNKLIYTEKRLTAVGGRRREIMGLGEKGEEIKQPPPQKTNKPQRHTQQYGDYQRERLMGGR